MSTINHQKLRELAFALQRMATPQKLLAFRAMLSPVSYTHLDVYKRQEYCQLYGW